MRLGYVGLGIMGGALARRLLLSHPLAVHDRDGAAVARLVAAGAVAAGSLAALAAEADAVFLCLPTSVDVEAVLFGPEGLAAALRPGSLVVDQTTGDPVATRRMAAVLAERGVTLVDAPVSGGLLGAEAGTISIMVGAEPVTFARLRPVLAKISSNVFHAGGPGAGHVVKLVNNMISGVQRLLTFEGVALAAKNGVDPARVVEILLAGGARNAYLDRMMGPRVLKGNLAPGFTLALMHKDLRLACALGIDSGVPMFFGNLAREVYQTCIAEWGSAAQVDTAALVMDRLAGTQVVPENPLLE